MYSKILQMLNQLNLLILRSCGLRTLVERIEANLYFQYNLWITFGFKYFLYSLVEYYNVNYKLFSAVRTTYWVLGHKIFAHILSYEAACSLEPRTLRGQRTGPHSGMSYPCEQGTGMATMFPARLLTQSQYSINLCL